jgi:hypothetical protein
MGITSHIFNIIKKLNGWMSSVNHADHPPKTVSAASATASSEPSAVRKGRRPPPPPERINLDVAQIMKWYRGNPPWSLRKIAKKLHANRGTILARIREYEAIEKEFKAAAEALKPKPHVQAPAAVIPSVPPPKPVTHSVPAPPPTVVPAATRHEPAPAPPPATPDKDWTPGFGFGGGTGVRWTAAEPLPPQAGYDDDPPRRSEGAGGLAGQCDGEENWK